MQLLKVYQQGKTITTPGEILSGEKVSSSRKKYLKENLLKC
jgi:hypothetical protein